MIRSANIPAAPDRHERRRRAKLCEEPEATAEPNQAAPGIGRDQPLEPLEFIENGQPQKSRRGKLRPLLISVNEAADYVNYSRSGFYKSILPQLETVTLGKRRLVVMASLDAFVERLRTGQASAESAAP
jgi:hypothetical protein